MKRSNLKIKVKIEGHSYTEEDLQNMDRWENEGGSSNKDDLLINIPLKTGQIFEVLKGDIIYEDGQLYYNVELKLLALH